MQPKDMGKKMDGKGSDEMKKECSSKIMPEHQKAMATNSSPKK